MKTTRVILVVGCLVAAIAASAAETYPRMADLAQYAMARADEVALAKSAAPLSAHHAFLESARAQTSICGVHPVVCMAHRAGCRAQMS